MLTDTKEAVRNGEWSKLKQAVDDQCASLHAPGSAAHARAASFADLQPILVSPDSGAALSLREGQLHSADGRETFPFAGASPVLLPRRAQGSNGEPDFDRATRDPFAQYLFLNIVKNASWPTNSEANDNWFRRHLERTRKLTAGAAGVLLDIGCDDAELSCSLFPEAATYVGLEPNTKVRAGFRVVGMAEFLPFADASIDGVAFLTSLDHVFDCHAAIDEAKRVLKPGGAIYLASLIWTHNAHLFKDSIHFHHFRDFELAGMLRGLDIEDIHRYSWKDNAHRSVVYLRARKPS